jgi:hypothetical protein
MGMARERRWNDGVGLCATPGILEIECHDLTGGGGGGRLYNVNILGCDMGFLGPDA